jgi:bZIP transcription factor
MICFSERNRVHAKKSRQRKKCLTHTLEDSLEALKEENAKLRESIYQVIGKAKTNEILEKRTMDEHYRFIDSVKSCRVIDKKTATFLRGLRKKMQAANKKREQRERK